ncbi:50S ribosomal protein L29 [Candidatus Gracilibacteria bacterium]|nr:50S ribosomal protein L29 [Candidatus Gracilibacteria bacterium]
MAPKKKTPVEKKDYSGLTPVELATELNSARKELFTLKMKHSLGELKQPHLIRQARRTVAQLSTELTPVL